MARVVEVVRRSSVAVAQRRTNVVNADAVGVQGPEGPEGPEGPQGPAGADGSGDNETFDDNLALLYAIAKL